MGHKSHMRQIPDTLGAKNADTIEKSWSEYQANRPEMHSCVINEQLNWFGNHRCKEEWECQGARVCEYM